MHKSSKLLLVLTLISSTNLHANEPVHKAADFMEERLLRSARDVESICKNASPEVKKKFSASYSAYKSRIIKVANNYRINFPLHEVRTPGILRDQLERFEYEERQKQLKPISKDVLNRSCHAMALNADLDTEYRINNEFESWFYEYAYKP